MKKTITILFILLVIVGSISIAEAGHPDETLNGRGRSDQGRNEPYYCGITGYAVVGYDEEYKLEKTDRFQNKKLWFVPTYVQDNKGWREKGSLPHQTKVLVKEQYLKHRNHGDYEGYLLVEITDNNKQCIINVKNFVTKPYWTFVDDLQQAAMIGYFVAEYKQSSINKPTTGRNEQVDIKNGTRVLVTGINNNKYGTRIKAIVWQKWKLGYGGVNCYFDAEDLSIVY